MKAAFITLYLNNKMSDIIDARCNNEECTAKLNTNVCLVLV
jgi:hypothetical protein